MPAPFRRQPSTAPTTPYHPPPFILGDTVILNATGVSAVTNAVTGGTGVINAFLFGSNVFTAPVNTCGFTDVDVLGVVDGYLYGPACSAATPLNPGGKGTISFSMTIPSEGAGLGTLNIIVNTTDQNNGPSWCANLTVTL